MNVDTTTLQRVLEELNRNLGDGTVFDALVQQKIFQAQVGVIGGIVVLVAVWVAFAALYRSTRPHHDAAGDMLAGALVALSLSLIPFGVVVSSLLDLANPELVVYRDIVRRVVSIVTGS